ncbi:hypothetical protein [Motiliproteus sp.]|uniref:hypothetical protein n=1 Tax=Motiliproteus sp. TaxID=1898955 RepID=UPI003BA96616
MDWITEAKRLFRMEKPEHFTNYRHCEECEEHDQTLIGATLDSIGLEELGNPGWDPICFATNEGKKYYMPALIRLSLETLDNDFYFAQLLFHLEYDGENNDLFLSCSPEQRAFIGSFIEFFILSHVEALEQNYSDSEALRAYEIWSKTP